MSKESSNLEVKCEELSCELTNFRVGVKETMDQVNELLAELDKIEHRKSPPRVSRLQPIIGTVDKHSSRRTSITVSGEGGSHIGVGAATLDSSMNARDNNPATNAERQTKPVRVTSVSLSRQPQPREKKDTNIFFSEPSGTTRRAASSYSTTRNHYRHTSISVMAGNGRTDIAGGGTM
jgi:hypothetical protein